MDYTVKQRVLCSDVNYENTACGVQMDLFESLK